MARGVGNGAGRPTKYKKEFCALVIRLGKEGVSRAGWAAQLDIAIATLYNWEENQPEFLEATTRARDLSLAWWNEQGRKGIWSRDFNAPAYRLQVMNRFSKDWRDRQEFIVTNLDEMSDEQLAALAAGKVPK